MKEFDINLWLLISIFLTHCVYCFVFYLYGIIPMVYFNIYSILNYAISIVLYSKENAKTAFFLTFVEIFTHQVVGSYYLGFESGFNIILMCLFFLQFTFFNKSSSIFICSVCLILSVYSLYHFKEFLIGKYSYAQNTFFYLNSFASAIFMIIYGALAAVSQSKKLADLTYLIHKDFLTGLFNRKYFEEKIIPSFNKDESILIAICDIDNFKAINDNFGHDIGDIVLKSVASSIHYEILEYKGVVARWGGEEFIVKVNLKNNQEAEHCMNIVKNSVARQELKKYNIKPTITIGGIFVQNPNKDDFEKYFKIADQELYFGKKSGKNLVNIKVS